MPRNVRNFYLEAAIDGRDSTLSGGPVAKDGGIDLIVKQRANGEVTTALTITGYQMHEGRLTLIVQDSDGRVIWSNNTDR